MFCWMVLFLGIAIQQHSILAAIGALILLCFFSQRFGENLNIFPKKPLLILNDQGITMYPNSYRKKHLAWNAITAIAAQPGLGRRRYVASENCISFKLGPSTFWSDNDVKILLHNLDTTPKEFFKQVKKYYRGPMYNWLAKF